jgi:large subunit ribosomal protein L4
VVASSPTARRAPAGPVRDYSQKTPKKMKAAALRGALSDRAREGRVHVVSAFVDGDAPKTKTALATLGAITQAKRVLIVLDREDVLNWVSLRNLPQVHLIEAGQLNTYDVLVADEVVFTEAALAEYVTARSKGDAAGTELPDLSTHLTPGGVPSIAPAEGEGTVETATAAEAAPVKKAAAKKAPAKKAAAADAPAEEAAAEAPAKKAPAKKAAAEKPAADTTAADTAADETTEEKA